MKTLIARARAAETRTKPAHKRKVVAKKSAEKSDDEKLAEFSPEIQKMVLTLRAAFGRQ